MGRWYGFAMEPGRPRVGGVPILMYHSIGAYAAPSFRRFAVPPGSFSAHMDYLAEGGFRTLTVSQVALLFGAGAPLPARIAALTFDDGFTDFYQAALPVLQKHGFTATIYVPTDYVGAAKGGRPVLSWSQLQEIAEYGVECGSHGHTHRRLDQSPYSVALDEARRSRMLLEDRLQRPVLSFAYPGGCWNSRARRAVAAAGFSSACVVDELVASPNDDPLALPRLTVRAWVDVSGLARLLARRPTRTAQTLSTARRWLARAPALPRLRQAGRRYGLWR